MILNIFASLLVKRTRTCFHLKKEEKRTLVNTKVDLRKTKEIDIQVNLTNVKSDVSERKFIVKGIK